MQVRVTVQNVKPVFSDIERRTRRALANAINRTLEETQARGQQLLHQRLTIRSAAAAGFLERLVKFERFDRAKPEQLTGQMGLQDTGTGTRRRSAQLLIRLTEGGVFTRPTTKPFFVPALGGARQRAVDPVPRALYPSALRLVATRFTINDPRKQIRRNLKTGAVRVMGKRRSYAIDPEFHTPARPTTLGVWQRQGPRETHKLWHYVTTIRLPKKYPFREEALREVRTRWPINVEGFLASELRRIAARRTAARAP